MKNRGMGFFPWTCTVAFRRPVNRTLKLKCFAFCRFATCQEAPDAEGRKVPRLHSCVKKVSVEDFFFSIGTILAYFARSTASHESEKI